MRLDLFPLDQETDDGLLTRLVEESAEVIQAVAKLRRFGPEGVHPEAPAGPDNRANLLAEIEDVRLVIEEIRLRQERTP